jgi:hypothetical protein
MPRFSNIIPTSISRLFDSAKTLPSQVRIPPSKLATTGYKVTYFSFGLFLLRLLIRPFCHLLANILTILLFLNDHLTTLPIYLILFSGFVLVAFWRIQNVSNSQTPVYPPLNSPLTRSDHRYFKDGYPTYSLSARSSQPFRYYTPYARVFVPKHAF